MKFIRKFLRLVDKNLNLKGLVFMFFVYLVREIL